MHQPRVGDRSPHEGKDGELARAFQVYQPGIGDVSVANVEVF